MFDYLSKVENLPGWATEFARELRYEEGKAKVVNGLGEFYFAIAADSETGVIDMYAGPTEDELGALPDPRRRAPRRPQRLYLHDVPGPGMPDELFESQYESLRREFDNIRREFGDDERARPRRSRLPPREGGAALERARRRVVRARATPRCAPPTARC